MSETKVNSELFRKIADRIEREPHMYDQRYSERENDEGEAACIYCFAREILGSPDKGDKYLNGRMMPDDDLRIAVGLNIEDTQTLYHYSWKPRSGLTVPEALRAIADGKSVQEVSA